MGTYEMNMLPLFAFVERLDESRAATWLCDKGGNDVRMRSGSKKFLVNDVQEALTKNNRSGQNGLF
jgi:hypothetical protein